MNFRWRFEAVSEQADPVSIPVADHYGFAPVKAKSRAEDQEPGYSREEQE